MQASARGLNWVNVGVLAGVHGLAVAGALWSVFHFSWATLALTFVWMVCSGLAITGGYHRLFAHPTYQARGPLKWFYLLFGAACVQNSALKWASDHRRHHAQTDREQDPYNIRKGFWWAHIGWVLAKDPPADMANVGDLSDDRAVRFQHAAYVPLALFVGIAVPAAIASLWGDAVGGILVAGFLRLALVYHATFSINSLAHTIGSRPYDRKTSARDSALTAILALGEGYHNFHHSFPGDYRNGIRAWHFDPTKWWIWTADKVRLAKNLRRTPPDVIARARAEA